MPRGRKNRRAGFQPLPGHLVSKLARATEFPSSPLLPVPSHAQVTRHFERDLEEAAIPKVTEEGVMVFHSWRGTYATLLDSLGASPKETQELMRHATPVMTMQRYVQARHDRQKALVQTMAEVVISARLVPEPPATGGGNDDNSSIIHLLDEEEEDEESGHPARSDSEPLDPAGPPNKARPGVVKGPDEDTPPPVHHPKTIHPPPVRHPLVPDDPSPIPATSPQPPFFQTR